MKNILLLCGGESTEHEVSLRSAEYIESLIDQNKFNIYYVCIDKNSQWKDRAGNNCAFSLDGMLSTLKETFDVHCAIPCIHGYPGETGDIQSLFEIAKVPFLASGSEASKICFNKITTKLWLESFDIPTTPYMILSEENNDTLQQSHEFFDKHGSVFIKASNQGSSVGCYPCDDKDKLEQLINKAFEYSDYVLIEKMISGREFEVGVFEYEGKIKTTLPGEIIVPDKFYDYDQKYSDSSQTKVESKVELPKHILEKVDKYAISSFKNLNLKHLARIDFFLTQDDQIFINEINTFPGHTKISLFPKMVEHTGLKYSDFLNHHLLTLTK